MTLGAEGSGVLLSLGGHQLDLESFTVEGWVKRRETAPPATAGEGGVIFGGGPSGMVFALHRDGRLILSGGGLIRVGSEASILDLEWHHVAVTRSGSEVTFFVDGVLGGRANYPAVFAPSSTYGIGKSASPDAGGMGTFRGSLDEITVYRGSLTPSAIQAIHAAGPSGKCVPEVSLVELRVIPSVSRDSEMVAECFILPAGVTNVQDVEVQFSVSGGLTFLGGSASAGVVSSETDSATLRVASLPLATGSRIRLNLKAGAPGMSQFKVRIQDVEYVRPVNIVPSCSSATGMVGYWPLDGSGVDLVEGGVGTLRGAAKWVGGRGGKGQALEVTGNADGLVVANPELLGLDVFSVEMWVRRGSLNWTTLNGVRGVIAAGTDGSFWLGLSPEGDLLFGQVGVVLTPIPGRIQDLAWHHLVMVREVGSIAFYLDGALAGRADFSGTFGSTAAFTIGSLPRPIFGVNNGFVGAIDDFTVWNRRLGEAEIRSYATASSGPFCPAELELETVEGSSRVLPGATNRFSWRLRNAGVSVVEGVVLSNAWTTVLGVSAVESSKGTAELSEGGLRVLVGRLLPGESVEVAMNGFVKGSGIAVLTSKAFLSSDLVTVLGYTETAIDVGVTCSPPIAGLEALYRGDGNLDDATGLHPGEQEDALWFAAGRVQEAFDFLGAGGVVVPDSGWLNRQDFTVDAWVYPTAYTGREEIIVSRGQGSGTGGGRQFELGIRGSLEQAGRIPTGNLIVFVGGINGMPDNENGWTDAGGTVPLNRWSHVAMAVEPGRVRVFLNGVKVSEFVGLTGSIPSINNPFRIGTRSQTFASWWLQRFDGRIDEVGVYTRALENGEVASLHAAGAAGRCDADLRISWEGVPGSVATGDSFRARLVVRNSGNQPLGPVTLTNTVPAGWTLTALTTSRGTVTWNAGTVTGELGILSGGERVTVDMMVRADTSQDARLMAHVHSQSGELSEANNDAAARVIAAPLFVTVPDAAREEGGPGGRLVLPVPVRLSVPVSWTVSMDYVIGPPRPGTGKVPAVGGVDFESVSGRLEFLPGEVEKVVPVVLLGDGFYEPDEVFGFTLGNPVGVTIEGLSSVLTILNDDAVPVVSVADVRMAEGDSGVPELVFPVTMVGLAGVDVEIVWATTNETALSPSDFAGGTGTVVIPSGSSAAEIRIPVVADRVEEWNEFFTLGVSLPPTAPGEVVLGKSVAFGTILNDDLGTGGVRGFEWVTPTTAVAGQPFGVELRAVDGRGGVVSNFNGVVTLSAYPSLPVDGSGLPSQLLITEVNTQGTAAVEFQNVTDGALDVSGWRVSLYDHSRWPMPRGTFVIPAGTVLAAGGLFRIQEGSQDPDAFPRFSLGFPLDWGLTTSSAILTSRPTAVLLQDASGALRDFFAAGGAEPSQITIPLTVQASEWPRFPLGGMMFRTSSNLTHQRTGWWNRRGAQGWDQAAGSLGTQNFRIRVPFVDGRPTAVSPPVLASFSEGVWTGTLALNPPPGSVRISADAGSGWTAVSPGIAFEAPGDLKIVKFEAASPFVTGGTRMTLQVVVTNGAPTPASDVMVEIPLGTELGLGSFSFEVLKSSQGTVTFQAASQPTRPRASIVANIGMVAAGGVVTVDVVGWPGGVGRLPVTLVAEVRRAGGGSGAGIDWAELPMEIVDPLILGRTGRIAWWRAELNARDAFGTNDGVATGVSYGRRFDQRTFVFDGDQAVVEVPMSSGLKPRLHFGLTVSAWIRARPGQRERQVVVEQSGGTNGVGFALILRDGKPSFEWDGQWIGTTSNVPDLRDGEWHYVSWLLVPDQSSIVVRIDRSLTYALMAPGLGDFTRASDGTFRIGRGATGGGFDGELDEITVYPFLQDAATHTADHGTGALGLAVSDARVMLTRQPFRISPITVGRPYSLNLTITNHGPLRIPNLDFRWQNHTSAIISEVRRDGVLVPSTKARNVDDADLGAFEAGQGSLLTITFVVNQDIKQMSSVLTFSAGLRDRVSTINFAPPVLADPDGDGLPTNWESANGLNPADPMDALQDRDGDGFGARAEYDAGTDPMSATSFPSVSWQTGEGGKLVLRVPTTWDRDYRLERTVTLGGSAGWELLERRAGTGGVLEFVVPATLDADQSYYQVKPVPLW